MAVLLAQARGHHPHCPAKRFLALVALWTLKASESESHRMRSKQMNRNPWRPLGLGGDSVCEEGIIHNATGPDGGIREEVHAVTLAAVTVDCLHCVCCFLEFCGDRDVCSSLLIDRFDTHGFR
ncbi:hypothetical protein KC19_VG254900 [Ceratodon purpureus]|uniref:Uncharacterized protein n=1 Tax=Ceratodon purpureus TaxID=3225 RepID=A0A8T0HV40_CERPU|nr:hypothetical protein KC19_VG254900 [Ceratodon purpureus]